MTKQTAQRTPRSAKTQTRQHVLAHPKAPHQPKPAAEGSEGLEIAKAGSRVKVTGPNNIEVTVKKLAEDAIDELLPDLFKLTGTRTDEVAFRIVEQVGNSLIRPTVDGPANCVVHAIRMIAELEPTNLTEAMLATQTIGTHEAAMWFLARATHKDQTVEGCDLNLLRATRLMRLHLDQIEAMQKLKGKAGQQRVVVEHVNVLAGGQAVVGAIMAPAGDGGAGGQ